MSKWWITSPMRRPSPLPMASTRRMTSTRGQPLFSPAAATIVDSATTDPTERSMPPVRMTKVIPTASTMRKALSMKRLAKTCPEAKPS